MTVTITPASLPGHELAGLPVRVADASDPTLVDRSGRVLDETRNTLLVAEADERDDRTRIRVPKADCVFEFRLSDGRVTVDGDRLLARPARRTERGGGNR